MNEDARWVATRVADEKLIALTNEERGVGWEKEYMTRWLMELGSGCPEDASGYIANDWYGEETIPANHPAIREYFDFTHTPHGATINQAGLDFIAGGRDDQERIPG